MTRLARRVTRFVTFLFRGYFVHLRETRTHSNDDSRTSVYKYKLQSGLRRERPGLSSCDFCESFRSPELLHLLDFGHPGKMGIDGGVLRTLGRSECCVRAAEDHPGQDKVGEGHRTRDQVTRGTRRKVRLNISKSPNQTFYMLVEGLPSLGQEASGGLWNNAYLAIEWPREAKYQAHDVVTRHSDLLFRKVNPLINKCDLLRIGTQQVNLGSKTAH